MVVNKDSETIFLIGAGFTMAAFPKEPLKAPSNKELLEAICNDGGKTLSKYKEEYKATDIEILLTKLDLDAIENEKKKAHRTEINAEISFYFSKYRFSALNNIPRWLETFSNEILKKNDSICCLNYDCSLEGALDYYGVWSPKRGYARVNNMLDDSLPENSLDIIIFKVHGSINFVKSRVVGKNSDQTAIGYSINPLIYPRSGANRYLGGGANDEEPYFIPPSFVKIPHVDIAAMMLDLLEVVKKARNLVIIGCGMRPEDSFLWLLLTHFLNRNVDKRLIIVDPTADEIQIKISNYWVGEISAEVVQIPSGIGEGIQELGKALGTST